MATGGRFDVNKKKRGFGIKGYDRPVRHGVKRPRGAALKHRTDSWRGPKVYSI